MNPIVASITSNTLAYAPAVLAGIQVAETSPAPGTTKLQAVVNGILGGSQVLEGTPNPTVAGIAALVNLFVSILNATGVFNHKATPAA
jgi:hypothetical protein